MTTPVRRVLDISHHNNVSDFQTVADNGIWGIIHKATEGTSYTDDMYAGRKQKFLDVGLLWGAYHFVHPGSVDAQVDFFLRVVGVDDTTLYALDWETSSSGTMNEDQAEQFLRRLEQKTGRKGVVYSGNTAKEEISGTNSYIGEHRLWLAQYSSSTSTQQSWEDWWLWQYSDGQNGPSPHGCPGVSGDVDTNSYEGSRDQLRQEWSGTGKIISIKRTLIAVSSGHYPGAGAKGHPVPPQMIEYDEAKRVTDRVGEILNSKRLVRCQTFTDTTSRDQQTNLETICNWHNDIAFGGHDHDYDVAIHFNARDENHDHGTACLYVTQEELAGKISKAVSDASGLFDQGAQYRPDLYVLKNTREPCVLIETAYVDNTSDANIYNAHFEEICQAIAKTLVGRHIPGEVPVEDRQTVGKGDEGQDVQDLQDMLNKTELDPGLVEDGDFGSLTESAVMQYQATRGLDVDGICGQQTWGALYDETPPLPPPTYGLSQAEIDDICAIAEGSSIASYSWRDRGKAPAGYTQGMALAFAQTYRKLKQGHPAAIDMAKRRQASDKDALNVYHSEFDALGMSNETAGFDTLRHLYALMLGHGMRESSGRHCEGRDMSASNVQSDTCEAGLFQTSYNAHGASDPEFDDLMAEYSANKTTCYLNVFSDGVECSDSEWDCYGSGAGHQFQQLCKECPPFAAETCALTLRNLCNHYGPIIRKETELKREAEQMLREVQGYLDSLEAVA